VWTLAAQEQKGEISGQVPKRLAHALLQGKVAFTGSFLRIA